MISFRITGNHAPIARNSVIAMLGTSLKTLGGISAVVNVYRNSGLFDRWPIVYLPTHVDGSRLSKLRVAVISFLRYVYLLGTRKIALIHVHSASGSSFWRKCFFILIAFMVRRPVILHLHGGGFNEFYEEECGRVRKFLVRFVLDRCSRIVVLSDRWRMFLSRITRNPDVVVVMNPVIEFNPENSRVRREPETLLFLGRVCKEKGIDVLFQALVEIKACHPAVRLLCGGDGDLERARLEAENLGLAENVEFCGWLDDAGKTKALRTASVFVLPSFIEGLPMSILEAMAAGLPVVSTRVGGIPDVVIHHREGLLVAPGDVSGLSEALNLLLDDRQLRDEMGRKGRDKFKKTFCAESILPKIESIYHEFGVLPLVEQSPN